MFSLIHDEIRYDCPGLLWTSKILLNLIKIWTIFIKISKVVFRVYIIEEFSYQLLIWALRVKFTQLNLTFRISHSCWLVFVYYILENVLIHVCLLSIVLKPCLWLCVLCYDEYAIFNTLSSYLFVLLTLNSRSRCLFF